MAMPRRILLFSAIGIILYLSLSLYHGHQLKKYPLLEREGGKALSARAEEKTWVQVSTTKQVAAGPVQPRIAQGQGGSATEEAAAGITGGQRQPASVPEQQQSFDPATATDAPRDLLSALQAELIQARTLLRDREEELRQARLELERTREEKQLAADSARTPRDELTPTLSAQERQLAELDRLRTELKEARARAAVAEVELERARLKAEAMFRYGQEQSRLLAPARQEVEILKTRLRETGRKLLQSEQQVADLNKREQQLRQEPQDRRSTPHEAKAPAAPAGEGNGPTAAGARAD